MYADDTSLCHQSRNLTQLNEAINSDLKKLETWLQGKVVTWRRNSKDVNHQERNQCTNGRRQNVLCYYTFSYASIAFTEFIFDDKNI